MVWAWAITVALTMAQVGGMFGGVSQVMHLLVPAVPVRVWVVVFLAITLALLLGGGYDRVERFAMVKVGLFTAHHDHGGRRAVAHAAILCLA